MPKPYFRILAIFVVLFLVFSGTAHALAAVQETDVTDPSVLVSSLNAVIVFLAVQLSKLIKSAAPAWTLGLIVPLLSALSAWILGQLVEDSSWLITFLIGFGSTFIHQLMTSITSTE